MRNIVLITLLTLPCLTWALPAKLSLSGRLEMNHGQVYATQIELRLKTDTSKKAVYRGIVKMTTAGKTSSHSAKLILRYSESRTELNLGGYFDRSYRLRGPLSNLQAGTEVEMTAVQIYTWETCYPVGIDDETCVDHETEEDQGLAHFKFSPAI
ncbi:MAG: hypothetical protein COT73_11240 [Bdellovibrio sp. CG10_big_fil_rev_8_21_14_0_10_47_8]|nr:MAG: hypothetical protein COT73_11240 [Bdellovibrio sp. CG10_big_fil_rev_8_21_14_0_10_47_8]